MTGFSRSSFAFSFCCFNRRGKIEMIQIISIQSQSRIVHYIKQKIRRFELQRVEFRRMVFCRIFKIRIRVVVGLEHLIDFLSFEFSGFAMMVHSKRIHPIAFIILYMFL
eukprot:comp13016_c0_seq3/m.17569 comp13016_c0_seq3/g.17569  ORF comp13016_c0_seq3/g.17569 comp13016_c0_seq3/m.17569 type:complete len:109 (+) comp13016_c0_seq3:878-1204(+)